MAVCGFGCGWVSPDCKSFCFTAEVPLGSDDTFVDVPVGECGLCTCGNYYVPLQYEIPQIISSPIAR